LADRHLPSFPTRRSSDLDRAEPEATIEKLFAANGWGAMWRNGVYNFLHYHATVHEVLGVARGHARVRFGGDKGKIFEISAGDVADRKSTRLNSSHDQISY